MVAFVKKVINVGAVPNDDTGDTLRQGGIDSNDNYTAIFDQTAYEIGGSLAVTYGPTGNATFEDNVVISDGSFTLTENATTGGQVINVTNAAYVDSAQETFVTRAAEGTGAYLFYQGRANAIKQIRILGNGNVENFNGVYGTLASDERVKENIVDATPKLADILALRVINFNIIGDDNKQLGFLGQEFEKIFPRLVKKEDNREYDEKGNVISGFEDSRSLSVGMEFAFFVKAIQELHAIIEDLK